MSWKCDICNHYTANGRKHNCINDKVQELEKKLAEIEEYSKPHSKFMWAAVILGIINDTDFRGESK